MPSNPMSWSSRAFATSHRILLERNLERMLPAIKGDILVVGAGRNPYAAWMAGEASVVVTDIAAELDGIDRIADVHDLPFAANSFDAVVAIEVFEHLRAPCTAVKEIWRVLRPSGELLLTVPFLFHVHGDPMDFTRFTRSGLQQLLASFKETEITHFGGRIHAVSDIITTACRPLVGFRLWNHLLAKGPLALLKSGDCPSGYIALAKK